MSSSISDSFWKPPLLRPGQFDWWKDQFEAHVCSLDGQLWRVIENGPLPIMDNTNPAKPVEKAKDKYTDEDYRCLEKNARAKKVLYMALSPGDQIKVAMHKTAKEMFDGLVRMYGGNEDIQMNRILAATKEYTSIMQGKDESLEDFYTRFQIVIGQLGHLGENLPDWKITHQFLQSLNSKWDQVTVAIQSNSNVKKMTLEELVANLQSQAAIIESKMSRRHGDKPHSVALKVEQTLEEIQENDDSENEEVALLTKAFTRFKSNYTRRKTDNKGSSYKDNSTEDKKEDRTCYYCQKKGHLAKDCYKKKNDEAETEKSSTDKAPKAMIATWGNSDIESENEDCPRDLCLMAHSTSSEVNESDSFVNDVFIHTDFVETIANLMKDSKNLEDRIAVLEEEHRIEKETNRLWSIKATQLEKQISEHECICHICEEKEYEIKNLCEELGQLKIEKTDIDVYKQEIEELNNDLIILQFKYDLQESEIFHLQEFKGELQRYSYELERKLKKLTEEMERSKQKGECTLQGIQLDDKIA